VTDLVTINCPLCQASESDFWAKENGFNCVKCKKCALVYVNPRPNLESVSSSVQNGVHILDNGGKLDTKTRRINRKINSAKLIFKKLFPDLLQREVQIKWLDVGSGYGEFMESLLKLLPSNSIVEGVEPMYHKAKFAKKRGLIIHHGYLNSVKEKYEILSILDVFSHVPDFNKFLEDVKDVLIPNGEILMKTGNGADIGDRKNFPGPLTLPDHLVFAGQKQIISFLEKAGFSVITIQSERVDNFWYSIKNTIKWCLGRPVKLSFPYTSPSRTFWIRAKLN